jgi:YD repeat-containing protein
MKIVWKGSKIPSGTLKAGDIIRYKKTSGSQHTLMYIGDSKIAEAGRKIRFPRIAKDTKKYNASGVKFSTIQVIRAK